VLANVDIGHTDPLQTVPLGATARLDCDQGRFEQLEPAAA
jgi:muramoyltetrapeptide carboxypeptidase LdcA involved in peptidoglycan recycling